VFGGRTQRAPRDPSTGTLDGQPPHSGAGVGLAPALRDCARSCSSASRPRPSSCSRRGGYPPAKRGSASSSGQQEVTKNHRRLDKALLAPRAPAGGQPHSAQEDSPAPAGGQYCSAQADSTFLPAAASATYLQGSTDLRAVLASGPPPPLHFSASAPASPPATSFAASLRHRFAGAWPALPCPRLLRPSVIGAPRLRSTSASPAMGNAQLGRYRRRPSPPGHVCLPLLLLLLLRPEPLRPAA
jgi:hypothetical protein